MHPIATSDSTAGQTSFPEIALNSILAIDHARSRLHLSISAGKSRKASQGRRVADC
jgi:hypothetical protein